MRRGACAPAAHGRAVDQQHDLAACAAGGEKLTRIAPARRAAVNFATERATVTAPEDVGADDDRGGQDAGIVAGQPPRRRKWRPAATS
jgi:hypothetical protein